MKSRTLHSLAVLAAAGLALSAVAAPPSSSPYFTDPQQSYVQDATTQAIGSVNMIACIMSAMRPDALVNQGPYVALVDEVKCNAAKQASTSNSSDGSGGSQAPSYMTAVVNSTRASNSAPMLVNAWISVNNNNNGGPVTVWAHISATEAPSATNPYGAFRLDYCGVPDSMPGQCAMNGFMQAANGTLTYYEADQGGGGETTALALASVGTTSGSGSLSLQQSGGGGSNSAFDFAYDASYYLRTDNGSTDECFSRDASDPATGFSVWSYGLYDSSTGEEINLDSGFPIQYTSGGTTYQGYLGYYGLSLQGGAPALSDGATVQVVNYSGGSSSTTSYTIVQNGGRLVRYTQQTKFLSQIDQIQFNTWIGATGTSGLPDANTQYLMYWNEASGEFVAVGEVQCSSSGCQTNNWQPANYVSVDPSFFEALGGVQGSSQSLGGNLFINLAGLSGAIDPSSVVVAYYVQDIVYPDDPNLPTQLYCIDNCPTEASLSAYFTQSGVSPVASPYLASTYNQYQPVAASALVTYAVDARAQLNDGTAAVTYTDPNAYQQYPQYQNGVMSGLLFVNPSDAACNGNQFCNYAANSAAVYYTWETGPNSWDQFTAVKDANGNYVHFDAPLQVNFQVPANASGDLPYGNYAGTSLVLQYGGFGNLWGIPGVCVSSVTNAAVDCNDPTAMFVPQFEIPYDPGASPQQGIVTTTVNNTPTTYLVKWLNREIRLAQKSLSVCQGDGLATSSATLPSASQLQNPSDPSSSVYLGTEPTVNAAPRVIQGVVEY